MSVYTYTNGDWKKFAVLGPILDFTNEIIYFYQFEKNFKSNFQIFSIQKIVFRYHER